MSADTPRPPCINGDADAGPEPGHVTGTDGSGDSTQTRAHVDALQELVKRRWDLGVLVSLAEGPLRYLELHGRCAAWGERTLDQRDLSRTLTYLKAQGCVTQQPGRRAGVRGGRYTLTPLGQGRRDLFNSLGRALESEPQGRALLGRGEGAS
jgi:DNA-binding HxlR family transcriptional regulator